MHRGLNPNDDHTSTNLPTIFVTFEIAALMEGGYYWAALFWFRIA
jgi:hypothetical protein